MKMQQTLGTPEVVPLSVDARGEHPIAAEKSMRLGHQVIQPSVRGALGRTSCSPRCRTASRLVAHTSVGLAAGQLVLPVE